MSETTDDETATIEAEPHEVLDPDDYNQTRRLKAIHRARENVQDALQNVTRGKAKTSVHKGTRINLAHAVAAYGHELLPLMREAEWEYEFDEDYPYDDIREYITMMGMVHHNRESLDCPPVPASMTAYDILNRFVSEVGLGVDFDDTDDEWEI